MLFHEAGDVARHGHVEQKRKSEMRTGWNPSADLLVVLDECVEASSGVMWHAAKYWFGTTEYAASETVSRHKLCCYAALAPACVYACSAPCYFYRSTARLTAVWMRDEGFGDSSIRASLELSGSRISKDMRGGCWCSKIERQLVSLDLALSISADAWVSNDDFG